MKLGKTIVDCGRGRGLGRGRGRGRGDIPGKKLVHPMYDQSEESEASPAKYIPTEIVTKLLDSLERVGVKDKCTESQQPAINYPPYRLPAPTQPLLAWGEFG